MPSTFKLIPPFFLLLLITTLFNQNPDPQIGDECILDNTDGLPYPCSDLNENEVIDILDIIMMANMILGED